MEAPKNLSFSPTIYEYKLMFNVFSSTTVLQEMTKPAVNVMLLHFGQFIGHDITLTPEKGDIGSFETYITYMSKISNENKE